jgi:hypothetical protein
MIFETWNIWTLHRVGLLITVSVVILKYKLNLMRVKDGCWNRGGTEPTGKCSFFYAKGNVNHELDT